MWFTPCVTLLLFARAAAAEREASCRADDRQWPEQEEVREAMPQQEEMTLLAALPVPGALLLQRAGPRAGPAAGGQAEAGGAAAPPARAEGLEAVGAGHGGGASAARGPAPQGLLARVRAAETHLPGVLFVFLLLAVLLAVPVVGMCARPRRSLEQEEESQHPFFEVPPAAGTGAVLASCKDPAPRPGPRAPHVPALCAAPPLRGPGLGGGECGAQLCEALLVPPKTVYTLLVPRLPEGDGHGTADMIAVGDAKGLPGLRAAYQLGALGGDLGDRRLVLHGPGGEVFASCQDAAAEPGAGIRAGLAIFGQADAPFGVLRPDGHDHLSGYSIRAHGGRLVHFRGDARAGSMNATDESGCLVAVTEAAGAPHRRVQVGPRVDAGLVALAVLGIDLLERARARAARAHDARVC